MQYLIPEFGGPSVHSLILLHIEVDDRSLIDARSGSGHRSFVHRSADVAGATPRHGKILTMKQLPVASIRLPSFHFFLLACAVIALMPACSSSKPPAEDSSFASTPKSAPHIQVAPTDKVLGSVDILTATQATQSEPGHLLAEGWAASAVSGAPIVAVTLLIDGQAVAETKTFRSRTDVSSAFDRPDFENSGWKMEVPLKKLGDGKHPVTVLAINKNGDKLILGGVSLTLE
jgi:hypothetical protein